jgi:hypothetical protein
MKIDSDISGICLNLYHKFLMSQRTSDGDTKKLLLFGGVYARGNSDE